MAGDAHDPYDAELFVRGQITHDELLRRTARRKEPHRSAGSEQRLLSVLLITAVFGMVIWTIPCGSLHAYVVSVDWQALGQDEISQVVTWRGIVSILVLGFLIGFFAQAVAIHGAARHHHGMTAFGPLVVGMLLGAFQGILVGVDWWGYTESNLPLRSLPTRILTGVFCGFVAVPAILTISAVVRNWEDLKRKWRLR